MGKSQTEFQPAPLYGGFIPDALEFQDLLKTVGNSFYHISGHRAAQSPQGLALAVYDRRFQGELGVFYFNLQTGGQFTLEFPLRAFDRNPRTVEIYINTTWNLYRFFAYFAHIFIMLPNLKKN